MVMLEDVALSRAFGEEVGRYFHEILRVERDRAGDGRASWRRSWATGGCGRFGPRAGARSRATWSWWGRGCTPTRCSRSGPASRWRTGSSATRSSRPRWRGSSRPGTCARTTAWCTAGGCGSSTGTWRCSRASTWRAGCWGRRSPTAWCRTSSATWRTGRAWSTWGRRSSWDEIVWRGDRDAGEFSAWYLDGGKVAAALSVGRSEDLAHARRLLESGADVSGQKDALADADSDLEAGRIRLGLDAAVERVDCKRTIRTQPVRAGVMATRLPLEQEFGVRVPGPQLNHESDVCPPIAGLSAHSSLGCCLTPVTRAA